MADAEGTVEEDIGEPDDESERLAWDCADEALQQGAEPRALEQGEDAGEGDYEALRKLLGEDDDTPTARRQFRTAYSTRLAAAPRVESERLDEESHHVAVEPDEPACSSADGHDWESPHRLVGGLRENPGVHGHGGGVTSTEVCVRCGLVRTTDSWAQCGECGEQGLDSVSYDDTDTSLADYLSELQGRIESDPRSVLREVEEVGDALIGRAGWRWWSVVAAPDEEGDWHADTHASLSEARKAAEAV